MKKLYVLLFTILITGLSFAQVINEFEPNPAGSDPTTSDIELKGTMNASFDLWLVSIENDGINGTADRVSNVTGTFDANGLAVVSVPDLENPSFTLVLSTNFNGSMGDDLDGDNDGAIDDVVGVFGTILDAVGVSDNVADDATMYGSTLGGTDILYNGQYEPLSAFRDGITGDWYNTVTVDYNQAGEHIGVFDASGSGIEINSGDFDSDPLATTFGAVNPSYTGLSTKDNIIDGFGMYPNPTALGYVNISSRSQTTMKVNVFDILGKQVINSTVINNRLDVSYLNPGLYIMRLTQDNATTTKKLVIQ